MVAGAAARANPFDRLPGIVDDRGFIPISKIGDTPRACSISPTALVQAGIDCCFMDSARFELLQGMPIFGALRKDVLEYLLSVMRRRRIPMGEFVFHEGDAADSLFVLESGRLSVLKMHERREVQIGQLNRGDCFGEMALVDMMNRSASVRAECDSELLELTLTDLASLWERDIEQFTLLQMNLGREISRRLRRSDQRLFALQARRGGSSESE